MSFTNQYYKRTAGTERPCFVCYKPTATVLATTKAVDFLYTCDAHLKDYNFATRIENDGTPKKVFSAEEIAKVREEYEAQQKAKKEREKEKQKEKDKAKEKEKDKDKDKDDTADKDKDTATSKEAVSVKGSSQSTTSVPAPASTSHEIYALHRDFFAMRQAEHRKRRQASQAKALAPRLPGAPLDALK